MNSFAVALRICSIDSSYPLAFCAVIFLHAELSYGFSKALTVSIWPLPLQPWEFCSIDSSCPIAICAVILQLSRRGVFTVLSLTRSMTSFPAASRRLQYWSLFSFIFLNFPNRSWPLYHSVHLLQITLCHWSNKYLRYFSLSLASEPSGDGAPAKHATEQTARHWWQHWIFTYEKGPLDIQNFW